MDRASAARTIGDLRRHSPSDWRRDERVYSGGSYRFAWALFAGNPDAL